MSSTFLQECKQVDIEFGKYKAKSPLLYQDVSICGTLFLADYEALTNIIPTDKIVPLKVMPGKGLISISCMEYKQCDIGPYNEVSISVIVNPPARNSISSKVVLASSLLTNDYYMYIWQLPVNTEIAHVEGVDLFNYPKFLADISFRETLTHRICTLRDKETKSLILEIDFYKLKTKQYDQTIKSELKTALIHTYPEKDNTVLHCRLSVNQIEMAETYLTNRAGIHYGKHPVAKLLKEINIGKQLKYVYAPKCECILFMPEAAGV